MYATIDFKKQLKAFAMSAVLIANPILVANAETKRSTRPLNVSGVVVASNPIVNALVRVYDDHGNLLATSNKVTDKDGYFEVTVPTETLGAGSSLVFQSAGGKNGTEKFDGNLLSTVPVQATTEVVHLNSVTTLGSLYQGYRRDVNAVQTEARLRNFLQIPSVVSLGYGVENPHLTVFSAVEMEKAAKANGGFNSYAKNLAREMAADNKTIHPFVSPKNKELLTASPSEWLAEKLLAGVAGKIGADIFSGFMAGIGFPDSNKQIIDLLNQVLARIAAIEASLHRIEVAIGQEEYNLRAGDLWKKYGHYAAIVDQMKATDLIAKKHPGDEKVKQDVIKAGQDYVRQINAMGMTFVTEVHSEFVTEGSITPLQKIFSQNQYLQRQLVNKEYLEIVNTQLEKYMSLQAVAASLYASALRETNPTQADSVIAVAKEYMSEQAVVLPEAKIFSSKDDMEAIAKGTRFYERETNLVWDASYQTFKGCNDMHTAKREFRVPQYDEMVNMLNRTGQLGKRFEEAVKNIGFSKQDAEGVKMIVFGCRETKYVKDNSINWFGNDQRGPWDQYYDSLDQFRSVANMKGVSSQFHTMKVKPLN
ncbi:hypothetical protein [Bdellovibrio sp. NC01]|uniref:hypothetical protein n=1 Tax=Bdellovibrio sp. NC01 TaxID=2220073 RepID=UPI0011594E8D|nr:hypothetical protein [Bdellovibrio sp. NC01]QDK36376.1 hypothetical protein DOE51_01550 [Bdellovibrio sp. NC01]